MLFLIDEYQDDAVSDMYDIKMMQEKMMLTSPTTAQSVASSMLGLPGGSSQGFSATFCSGRSYIWLRSELHLNHIREPHLGCIGAYLTISLTNPDSLPCVFWFWFMCASSESGRLDGVWVQVDWNWNRFPDFVCPPSNTCSVLTNYNPFQLVVFCFNITLTICRVGSVDETLLSFQWQWWPWWGGWMVLRKVMVDNDSDVNPTSFPASQCSLMLVTTIIRWWQLWSLDGDTDGHNNHQIISTIQLWYHVCFLLLSLDGEGALLRIKIIVMMRVFMKIMTNQNVNEVTTMMKTDISQNVPSCE